VVGGGFYAGGGVGVGGLWLGGGCFGLVGVRGWGVYLGCMIGVGGCGGVWAG